MQPHSGLIPSCFQYFRCPLDFRPWGRLRRSHRRYSPRRRPRRFCRSPKCSAARRGRGPRKRQGHRRDMPQDGPDQPVRHQGDAHHQDHAAFVPGALPHLGTGPAPLLCRRGAADQPVRQHQQHPGDHQPPEPAPQGRHGGHRCRNGGLHCGHSRFIHFDSPFSSYVSVASVHCHRPGVSGVQTQGDMVWLQRYTVPP